MRKDYTVKERKQLEKNPYTLKTSKNRVYFTAEFKKAFWEQYQAGKRPREILTALGYDQALLSQGQIDSLAHRIREQGEQGRFTDVAGPMGRLPIAKDLDDALLEPTPENMARLWTEIRYLKAKESAFSRLVPEQQETRARD